MLWCLTFEMYVSIYIFTRFLLVVTLSGHQKHLAVYLFMFAGWRFWCTQIGYLVPLWILMNSNGYSNLRFSTLLLDRVVARILQFHCVALCWRCFEPLVGGSVYWTNNSHAWMTWTDQIMHFNCIVKFLI